MFNSVSIHRKGDSAFFRGNEASGAYSGRRVIPGATGRIRSLVVRFQRKGEVGDRGRGVSRVTFPS